MRGGALAVAAATQRRGREGGQARRPPALNRLPFDTWRTFGKPSDTPPVESVVRRRWKRNWKRLSSGGWVWRLHTRCIDSVPSRVSVSHVHMRICSCRVLTVNHLEQNACLQKATPPLQNQGRRTPFCFTHVSPSTDKNFEFATWYLLGQFKCENIS